MVTTRHQTAVKEGKTQTAAQAAAPKKAAPTKTRGKKVAKPEQDDSKSNTTTIPAKRHQEPDHNVEEDHPRKKPATAQLKDVEANASKPSSTSKPGQTKAGVTKPTSKATTSSKDTIYTSGTIERGHIYFFYRPKVQLEEAQSIDDVKNFHMLLIPRPPEFAVDSGDKGSKSRTKADPSMTEEAELKVLAPGADAVPAPVTRKTTKQHYRLLSVGKKKLPDPQGTGQGHRKETFWAMVTSVGEDLREITEGLGPKSYETKTRGTRHEAAARLVARGGYALVNSEASTPSQRETHLGYHVSHPAEKDMGDVQASLGIHSSSSFVVQVKNPLAPNTAPQMSHSKQAEYPEWIMDKVFGAGSRGRNEYGLRFASCETPELLDAVGAQLLLIAAREGDQGLEISLGDGRGEALAQTENEESKKDIDEIFKEIGLDDQIFTQETLEGEWA